MIVKEIGVEGVNEVFWEIVWEKNVVVVGMMGGGEGEWCGKDEDMVGLVCEVEGEKIGG